MSEDQRPIQMTPELSRFFSWASETQNFEATDFNETDVLEGLQTLAIAEGLSDPAFDFVMALFLAMGGSHPKFRLRLERPEQGSDFARVSAIEKARISIELANEIDVAVAQGMKQEAIVLSVMQKHKLSRREVLRRLKAIRDIRAANLEYCKSEGGAEVLAEVPKGYRICENGRLVTSGSDD